MTRARDRVHDADDYRRVFLSEAADYLLELVDGLLAIERAPGDRESVESVFRAAHNLKSMASAMGCDRTSLSVHRMESLMDSVRRGARPADALLVDRMLRSVDETRRLIELESGDTLPVSASGSLDDSLAERAGDGPGPLDSATVRVPVARIDELAELTERLDDVAARLGMTATIEGAAPGLAEAVGDLRDVARALRAEVTLTRTVTVGSLFRRYPRVVRDLGRDLGKDVALVLEGADIEADRAVVDRMAEPIAHLLRNAVDHGIERPPDRVAAGKPERGTVRLAVVKREREIAISVSDDGAGIDAEAVWAQAVRGSVVEARERVRYGEEDVQMLCCLPGLSTVRAPTAVSGHGVGLDVVCSAVRDVGGVVSVRSGPREGTTFTLRLPAWLGDGAVPLAAPTLFGPDEDAAP